MYSLLQVTRLRLSMMDSVSLSRGLGTVAALVAGLAWVTLADLCLDSEQWRLVAGVLSSQPRWRPRRLTVHCI